VGVPQKGRKLVTQGQRGGPLSSANNSFCFGRGGGTRKVGGGDSPSWSRCSHLGRWKRQSFAGDSKNVPIAYQEGVAALQKCSREKWSRQEEVQGRNRRWGEGGSQLSFRKVRISAWGGGLFFVLEKWEAHVQKQHGSSKRDAPRPRTERIRKRS